MMRKEGQEGQEEGERKDKEEGEIFLSLEALVRSSDNPPFPQKSEDDENPDYKLGSKIRSGKSSLSPRALSFGKGLVRKKLFHRKEPLLVEEEEQLFSMRDKVEEEEEEEKGKESVVLGMSRKSRRLVLKGTRVSSEPESFSVCPVLGSSSPIIVEWPNEKLKREKKKEPEDQEEEEKEEEAVSLCHNESKGSGRGRKEEDFRDVFLIKEKVPRPKENFDFNASFSSTSKAFIGKAILDSTQKSLEPQIMSQHLLIPDEPPYKVVRYNNTTNSPVDRNSEGNSFPGFCTGKEKDFKISETALEQAKNAYKSHQSLLDHKIKKPKFITPFIAQVPPLGENMSKSSFQGFLTGNGKAIKISNSALNKARALYEYRNEYLTEDVTLTESFTKNISEIINENALNVSKFALKKVKNLIESEEEGLFQEKITAKKVEGNSFFEKMSESSFQGFSTGNGKAIKISDSALIKAKLLFKSEQPLKAECSLEKVDTIECRSVRRSEGLSIPSKNTKTPLNKNLESHCKLKRKIDQNIVDVCPTVYSSPIKSGLVKIYNKSKNTPEENCQSTRLEEKIGQVFDEVSNQEKNYLSCDLQRKSCDVGEAQLTHDHQNQGCETAIVKEMRNSSKGTIFGGFSTGSGKNIIIPKDAICRAQELFGVDFGLESHQSINTEYLPNLKNEEHLLESEIFSTQILAEVEETEKQYLEAKRKNTEEFEILINKNNIIRSSEDDNNLIKTFIELTDKQNCLVLSKTTIAHEDGYFLSLRKSNRSRVHLKSFNVFLPSNDEKTVVNVRDFVFKGFHSHIDIPNESTIIIPNEIKNIGFREISRAFIAIPSVNRRKLTDNWIRNHYKWIILYLISLNRCRDGILNPSEVLYRLRYRYDREIVGSDRSVLKKIYEGDDTASKPLVLFVVDRQGDRIELSDGWYSIISHIRPCMSDLFSNGKIRIGTKLYMEGAEIERPKEGRHFDPLEKDNGCSLKFSVNSCRRARWWTKLGTCSGFPALVVRLDSIKDDGGTVCRIRVLIRRCYPILYMEKKGNKITYVNERIYRKRIAALTRRKEENVESVYLQVQKEYEEKRLNSQKNKRTKVSRRDIKNLKSLTTGEQISDFIESCQDASVVEVLSSAQINELQNYKSKEAEKAQQDIKTEVERRLSSATEETQYVPILRLKVVDKSPNVFGILSIWRPSDDHIALLQENESVIMNRLNVARCRYVPEEVMLSSMKSSTFTKTENSSMMKGHFGSVRSLASIFDIITDEYDFQSNFNEADIVGYVVRIDNDETRPGFKDVYLVDLMNNFVRLKFWGSIKNYGMEAVIIASEVLYFQNLRWRRKFSDQSEIPSLFVTEQTEVSANPKDYAVSLVIKDFKTGIQLSVTYRGELERILDNLLIKECPETPSSSLPPKEIPTPLINNDLNPFLATSSDPVLATPSEKIQLVPDSPAAFQSSRNKIKLAKLEKVLFYDKNPSLLPLPPNLSRYKSSPKVLGLPRKRSRLFAQEEHKSKDSQDFEMIANQAMDDLELS